MNRLIRVILFVLPLFCLLTGISSAVPDFYYYDNFMAGMSPFSVPTSIELDNSGYWEDYSPIQDNLGFVTSYDNVSMSGATPTSAVPSYDMDWYIGKKLMLPPGEAIVIYSSSGQHSDNNIYIEGSNIFALPLGTTSPANLSLDYGDTALKYGSNALYSDTEGTLTEVPYVYQASQLPSSPYLNGILSETNHWLPMSFKSSSPYKYSMVYLLINFGDEAKGVFWNGYSGTDEIVSGISYKSISWAYVTNNTYVSTSTSSSGNYFYFVPHINADFDVYSFTHSNAELSEYYNYTSNYDYKITNLDFSNYVAKNTSSVYIPVTFGKGNGTYGGRKIYFNTELTNIPASSGLVPIFIHQYNATRYIDGKAIYIYDGYINVQNYDELVALLKENGYSGDLARVIQLLDEINSGGENGDAVKELMNVLEAYHQQIQNNANFKGATGVFDTYKNILEFTSDMHWLVTANNALFEYFAGFIMLCCMFLFLSRVMR